MNQIEYLSPTSISKWYENREEFYLWYLCDERPPKDPQTQPMSVGSAFDAFVKSYLHEALFGKGHDLRFDLRTLFEAQVQPHHRDFAWDAGAHCFAIYRDCGALNDLLLELNKAVGTPKFEMDVKGVVSGYREGISKSYEGVTFLGKPDVFFINNMGAHVVLDWKVNGYCSDYGASPSPGYVRLRNNPKINGHHKDAFLQHYKGVMINIAHKLEHVNLSWARQLCIYGWLCGEEIGGEFIAAIDQIACRGSTISVANHRTLVCPEFQWKVFCGAQEIWDIVHTDHIFRDMEYEQSKGHQEFLEGVAKVMRGEGTPEDEWFVKMTRETKERYIPQRENQS